MKVEVDQERNIVLKGVFNSVVFETKEGRKLVICMCDNGFDIGLQNENKGVISWAKADYLFEASRVYEAIENLMDKISEDTNETRKV
jgi:hypothetical protein